MSKQTEFEEYEEWLERFFGLKLLKFQKDAIKHLLNKDKIQFNSRGRRF